MKFKKLPYGMSNFADIIEGGYAYVDKSHFIELLEDENNPYQICLRPRRFGKSLFLSVLENYYDLGRKNKFESLFGDLYIGEHSTPEQGKYAILSFNFSGLDTADSRERFKASFLDRIEKSVIAFFDKYKEVFTNAAEESRLIREQKPGVGALDSAYNAAASTGVRIFAIIDEYDHFANNLIAMGKTYTDEIKAGGIIRTFYESLKIGTSSIIRRIFITGVSPMMLCDLSSGFNMATNLSFFDKYNDMFGFTRGEVGWLARETGVDMSLIQVDMESYYNGYMFSDDGLDRVYNPQMVLYLFYQTLMTGKQPKQIIDDNLRTDSERLRRLVEDGNNLETMMCIVKDGGIITNVKESFSIGKLNSNEYFVSLLFYLGLLTKGDTVEGLTYLKIPNYSIKTLFWEYLAVYIQELEENSDHYDELKKTTQEMAFRGNAQPYLDFFSEKVLKHLSNRDLTKFDEKYVKVMLLVNLLASNLYLPKSEDENINGYTDIYLQKHPAGPNIKFEYVFEIKYIKTDAKNRENEKASKLAEAFGQIEKYKKAPRFANRSDIKFFALVFEGKGDYDAKEV
jgi:hypothetical protein